MEELESHSEKSIVRNLIKGDFEAFDQLFRCYNQRLYFFAKSILKDKEDACDVVQEVFLRIWRTREKIDEKQSFRSLIFTIAYNNIVDTLRKKISERNFRSQLIDIAIVNESPVDEKIEFDELDSYCRKVIEEMPPRRKEIYKLHRFSEMSYEEIAGNLNISVSTVRNQMTKAISYLRDRITTQELISLLYLSLFI